MSREWSDGVGGYTNTTGMLTAGGWTNANGVQTIAAAGGTANGILGPFNGPHFWTFNAGSGPVYNYSQLDTSIFHGHMRQDSGHTARQAFLTYSSAGGVQVQVVCNLDGSFSIYRGNSSGTLIGTSGIIISKTVWKFLSFEVTIHGTTGVVIIRDFAGATLYTTGSVNTVNQSGQLYTSQIELGANSSGFYWANLWMNNTTGSAPWNAAMLEQRIQTSRPSGAGTTTQMTKVGAAATNAASVADTNPDGDTTAVTSSTVGQFDTYAMSDLSGTPATITTVVAKPVWKKTDAGARQGAITTRSGGTNYDSASVDLPASYAVGAGIDMPTDPNTGSAWTAAGWNAVEQGPKLAT